MAEDSFSSPRPLILVDESVEGDRRVAQSVSALPGAEMIDIRNRWAGSIWRRGRSICSAIWLIVSALCNSPFTRKRRIAPVLAGVVQDGVADGLVSMCIWTYRSLRTAHVLQHSRRRLTLVHAHDLYCGLCALAAAPSEDCRLIYNAHELEIHRNRRAGWLRILVEHDFERRILERADEVIVVNAAIAETVRRLYPIAVPNFRVEYNDFYQHHPMPHPDAAHRPSIVYVGKGIHGRQLERLDRPEDELGFSVHGYFLGRELPARLSGRFWRLGPADYESDLLSLVRSRRCLMWCCLDADALSYKLALPNKFFQALAVGIPIIASRGTYLAELVDRYRLGTVLDGGDVAQLAPRVQSPDFECWTDAVAEFREAFRKGALVI
jgi:glycosyltransferase involved in cell wall biosynthesis